MRAAELLQRLTAAGLSFRVDGDRLLVRPRSRLRPELADLIRAHRGDLIATLRPPRAIVEFRWRGDRAWAICLGADGETVEHVIAELRRRFGDELEVRPREVRA